LTLAHAALEFAKSDSATGRALLDRAAREIDALKDGRAVLPRFASVAARSRPSPELAHDVLDRLAAAGLLPTSPAALKLDLADKAVLEVAVGRLYLADARNEEARAWLEPAVELRAKVDVPESPWLEEAHTALSAALAMPRAHNEPALHRLGF
jgi:hypothetical protein